MNGQGKVSFLDGSTYKGSWKDGKFHGLGKYNWPNGNYYYGNWENDVRKGFGKHFDTTTGNLFEGHWEGDKKNGDFIHHDGEGHCHHEFWRNDKYSFAVRDKHSASPF